MLPKRFCSLSFLQGALARPSGPWCLTSEIWYSVCAGVFLSGGNVMDRETALMAPMSRSCALSATAGLDVSSARMATALAHMPYATLTGIALMGLMKTMPFVVC